MDAGNPNFKNTLQVWLSKQVCKTQTEFSNDAKYLTSCDQEHHQIRKIVGIFSGTSRKVFRGAEGSPPQHKRKTGLNSKIPVKVLSKKISTCGSFNPHGLRYDDKLFTEKLHFPMQDYKHGKPQILLYEIFFLYNLCILVDCIAIICPTSFVNQHLRLIISIVDA